MFRIPRETCFAHGKMPISSKTKRFSEQAQKTYSDNECFFQKGNAQHPTALFFGAARGLSKVSQPQNMSNKYHINIMDLSHNAYSMRVSLFATVPKVCSALCLFSVVSSYGFCLARQWGLGYRCWWQAANKKSSLTQANASLKSFTQMDVEYWICNRTPTRTVCQYKQLKRKIKQKDIFRKSYKYLILRITNLQKSIDAAKPVCLTNLVVF